MQNRYNVADRSSAEVLALCERERLAFIPWAPIAGGSTPAATASTPWQKLRGVSVWQAAIAWLLAAEVAVIG